MTSHPARMWLIRLHPHSHGKSFAAILFRCSRAAVFYHKSQTLPARSQARIPPTKPNLNRCANPPQSVRNYVPQPNYLIVGGHTPEVSHLKIEPRTQPNWCDLQASVAAGLFPCSIYCRPNPLPVDSFLVLTYQNQQTAFSRMF